ncbi:fructosamine kinase family protein [Nonomuraea soli]|uniref:Fructosamine-3-kinase n=1 Tax=Nonomuraea soli TaxID=1032476 RepID=A0A7W0HT31_9ACTN|nr:fructosamine kinase family protein [Nonomuraea soli]MBA2894296.1 fructosamine-3-kinase [Nonomuraea soli]
MRRTLGDGREVFVKSGPVSPLFTSEAAGLRWLGPIAVPVISADERHIAVEWVEPEPPTAAAAERFGRDLAATHARGAPAFGAGWPGFIGPLPMDNTPASDWPAFYASQRVLPFVRQAGLDPAPFERALRRAHDVPAEPPARIHGDLWNGNVLWSGGRGVLIDAAAHGGHRETDLAMLALFGAPHLDRILAAYQEVSPLADGWRDRVPLHQLHPLAVHVVLFGGGYRESLISAVTRLL